MDKIGDKSFRCNLVSLNMMFDCLSRHKGIYSFIVTNTIQVRTITNYIIPPHIRGAHFYSVPS